MVLPISGWLANHIGRKRLLLACVAGFTLTSLCCGLATSLSQLIIFRILQGLTGGGLQPLAQAILLETFPKERHGHAMAAFGIGILLAPILGPTLGGWITDNYSWRWIFYLNLPVGILSLFLMNRFVFDPHYVKRGEGKVDLWGIGFLALGIGSLQILLDTGQRKDWFSSRVRFRSMPSSACSDWLRWSSANWSPTIPLWICALLKNRSFSAAVFFSSACSDSCCTPVSFCSPLYLQTLMGYPAYNSGLALSPRGLGCAAVYSARRTSHDQNGSEDVCCLWGWDWAAITMFQLSGLNFSAGFWDIFWAQVLQGVSLSFPVHSSDGVGDGKDSGPEKMGNATSIFNLMRNIGGSVGIAIMTTFLARRTQIHQSHLVAKITPGQR